eukprot:7228332-Prymnesium_polylepis.1
MPPAVCGRVHRTSLPTPPPSSPPNMHEHKPPYLDRIARPVSTPWLPLSWPSCITCSRASLWWSWLMAAASSKASSSAWYGREGGRGE